MGKDDDPLEAILAIAAGIALGAGLIALLKMLSNNEQKNEKRR